MVNNKRDMGGKMNRQELQNTYSAINKSAEPERAAYLAKQILAMQQPAPGKCCQECGGPVTEAEYSIGESTCCKAGVGGEEDFNNFMSEWR